MSIEDNERADRDDRTIFVSGITEKVTEPLLTELFLSAGNFVSKNLFKRNLTISLFRPHRKSLYS